MQEKVPNQIDHRRNYFARKGYPQVQQAVPRVVKRGKIIGPDGKPLTLAQQLGLVPVNKPTDPEKLVKESNIVVREAARQIFAAKTPTNLKPVNDQFEPPQAFKELEAETNKLQREINGQETAARSFF